MKAKVSLNILNYNTFEKTRVCIDSCLKQEGVEFCVLLIDNSSTDGSYEKLRLLYGDKIQFLLNEENYGFAKGNNIGVEYCKKRGIKYSFLLNSDTELVGCNLVAQLIKVAETLSDCAVVSPNIYDVTRKGKLQHTNDSFYLKMLRWAMVIPKNIMVSEKIMSVSEAHGSALLVDNEAFMAAGGFPEQFFMYGEESLFSKKVLWGGERIYWYKDMENYVLHHHDKSTQIDAWRSYLMGRNRGLEYWEYKRAHLLWPVVYRIFYLSLIGHKIQMKSYLDGLRYAKELYKQGFSNLELYNHAKEIRDNYKG